MKFKRISLTSSNILLLLSFIELVESRTLKIKPLDQNIVISIGPRDREFASYKIQLGEVFKLVRMGGSFHPRIEYAVIKNENGETMKLVKKNHNYYKLIFNDGSYFENRSGKCKFFMVHQPPEKSRLPDEFGDEEERLFVLDSEGPKTPGLFSPLIQPLLDLNLNSGKDVFDVDMLGSGFYSERLPNSGVDYDSSHLLTSAPELSFVPPPRPQSSGPAKQSPNI